MRGNGVGIFGFPPAFGGKFGLDGAIVKQGSFDLAVIVYISIPDSSEF
jgi:hypothetical protein